MNERKENLNNEVESKKSEKKGNKYILVLLGVAFALILIIASVKEVNRVNNEKLLAETPLVQSTYWYSLDQYPKYKLEAAKSVDKLIAEGKSEDEAIQIAINEVSDKIYNDTIEFSNEWNESHEAEWDDPDVSEEFQKDYEEWLVQNQK